MSRSRPGTQSSAKKWATATTSGPSPESTSLANVACRLKAPLYISDRALPPENETVAIIQEWLRIPGTTTSGPDGLEDSADVHEPDPYFSPEQLAERFPNQLLDCNWTMVPGPVFGTKGRISPIIQGVLSDTWFLSALGAVALRGALAEDLFPELAAENSADNSSGLYTVQLYKYGYWQQVLVSGELPCGVSDSRLLVATSGSPEGELWVSLVEKAYAKIHGGYQSLESGSIGEALVDLTGGVVTKLNLQESDMDPGLLWHQLVAHCKEGCILMCMARWKVPPPDGLQVLPNIGYCITDTDLANGTQMLQVNLPVVLQKNEMFKHRHAHEGSTFWITYSNFLASFNRIWVAQLFPSKWHQLTLHCGFHGPTAGGPYRLPSGSVSSSWCCNPQFRLSVRKPCTITLCVGQRDPQVVYGGHVKRSERSEQHGMTVLQVDRDSATRQWEVVDSAVVAETGASGAREVVATIKAQPSCSYIVVPYCSTPGQEGPFVLRMFSGCALEVEQLPSPFSLVLGGTWTAATAGGGPQEAAWGSNPQFMLTVQHRSQAIIALCRSDLKYAIAKPLLEDGSSVGFLLARPEAGPQGLGRRTAIRTAQDKYDQVEGVAEEEAMLLTSLQPETPYVLVPYTSQPGLEAPFELRVISATPVELVPLPDSPTITLHGEWTAENAGGCNLNNTWRQNPKYLLTVQHKSQCRVQLTSLHGGWKRNKPLDDMIGFYILRGADERGRVEGDWKRAVLSEAPFVPMADNSAQYEFLPEAFYLLMPCTYSAGKLGRYTFTASSSEPGLHFAAL